MNDNFCKFQLFTEVFFNEKLLNFAFIGHDSKTGSL